MSKKLIESQGVEYRIGSLAETAIQFKEGTWLEAAELMNIRARGLMWTANFALYRVENNEEFLCI